MFSFFFFLVSYLSNIFCFFIFVKTNYQTPAPPYTFKDKMIHKSIIYMWVLTR